jgi:Cu-processing system permease protein
VDAGAYLALVGFAVLLALTSLSVGLLISAGTHRTGTANAVALFVWLALVFFGDLGLMGTAITMRLSVGTLFGLTLVNPLEAYRIGAVQAITGSVDALGSAGVFAARAFGDGLVGLLVGVLLAWAVVPLALAGALFQRRGIL